MNSELLELAHFRLNRAFSSLKLSSEGMPNNTCPLQKSCEPQNFSHFHLALPSSPTTSTHILAAPTVANTDSTSNMVSYSSYRGTYGGTQTLHENTLSQQLTYGRPPFLTSLSPSRSTAFEQAFFPCTEIYQASLTSAASAYCNDLDQESYSDHKQKLQLHLQKIFAAPHPKQTQNNQPLVETRPLIDKEGLTMPILSQQTQNSMSAESNSLSPSLLDFSFLMNANQNFDENTGMSAVDVSLTAIRDQPEDGLTSTMKSSLNTVWESIHSVQSQGKRLDLRIPANISLKPV